jgi:hypothetical protein
LFVDESSDFFSLCLKSFHLSTGHGLLSACCFLAKAILVKQKEEAEELPGTEVDPKGNNKKQVRKQTSD